MKTRKNFLFALLVLPVATFAQTQLNKTIPVSAGQTISLRFDYPELIRVSTWDKNEISVQGTVAINNGENDDAFLFENSVNGSVVDIRTSIKDIKHLPHRITIERDGQKIVFKDKAEWKKYQQEHGGSFNNMSMGVDVDVQLEIKVPKNVVTKIEATYGMVEIKNFDGPLTVEATYGGVDAALAEKSAGEVIAETNYGEIFSNLEAKFKGSEYENKDFHTYVSAKPGSGPKYSFESKYGNVYIRKAN